MHPGGRAYAGMPASALQRRGRGRVGENRREKILHASLEVAITFCAQRNKTAGPQPVKRVHETCASEHVCRHRTHEQGRLRSREPGRACKGARDGMQFARAPAV